MECKWLWFVAESGEDSMNDEHYLRVTRKKKIKVIVLVQLNQLYVLLAT